MFRNGGTLYQTKHLPHNMGSPLFVVAVYYMVSVQSLSPSIWDVTRITSPNQTNRINDNVFTGITEQRKTAFIIFTFITGISIHHPHLRRYSFSSLSRRFTHSSPVSRPMSSKLNSLRVISLTRIVVIFSVCAICHHHIKSLNTPLHQHANLSYRYCEIAFE